MHRLLEVLVFVGRLDRVLAVAAVGGLFILGAAELAVRLDDPMPLLFWLPTLWGGAALIVAGHRVGNDRLRIAKVIVLLGCAIGFVPSAWTLVMPVLLIAMAIRTISRRDKILVVLS
jgi:hypothetical protein